MRKGNTLVSLAVITVIVGALAAGVGLVQKKTQLESRAAVTTRSVVLQGELRILHGDDFDKGKSLNEYFLKGTDGKTYKLDLGTLNTSQLKSGNTLSVSGTTSDGNTITVTSATTVSQNPDPYVAPSLGTKKVAVVLFNFTNTTEPYTPEQARGYVFTNPDSAKAYYKETSFDKLDLVGRDRTDGDVYGWVAIPFTSAGCDSQYVRWSDSARSILESQGKSFSGYDLIIYGFPRADCWWNGLAGENESWINGKRIVIRDGYPPYDATWVIIGHELGHNFGMGHAYSSPGHTAFREDGQIELTRESACSYGAGGSTPCREYGDPFDIMGYLPRHLNTMHKGEMYWYSLTDHVRAVYAPGEYLIDIYPIEQLGTGARVLVIPRVGTDSFFKSDYYYVEFRRPNGGFDSFPSDDPNVNGIQIRVGNHNNGSVSLLDMNPGDPDSGDNYIFGDDDFRTNSALPVGRKFVDPFTGITIETMGVDDVSAQVKVNITNSPPIALQCSLSVYPNPITVQSGQTVNLSTSVFLDSPGYVSSVNFRPEPNKNLISLDTQDVYRPFQSRVRGVAAGTTWIDVNAYINRYVTTSVCGPVRVPVTVVTAPTATPTPTNTPMPTPTPTPVPLGEPLNFQIINRCTPLEMRWDAVTGASDYHLTRCKFRYGDSCNDFPGDWVAAGTTTNTTFTDSPIPNAHGYAYQVKAHNHASGVFGPDAYDSVSVNVPACQTPTPTPVPCASPASPAGLNTTCNGAGTQATVSWNAALRADYYSLRVNNTSYTDVPGFCGAAGEAGTGPNDFCRTPVGTAYTFSVIPNQSYDWWVHSRVNCNAGYWSAASVGSFVCKAPTPTPTKTLTPTPTPTSLTLYPTADTFAYAAYPTSNYGTRSTLQVDGGPIKVIYLKFNLSSLAGKSVSSAKLQFKITNSSSSTQKIKRVANTSWTETGLTYSNRPALGTTVLSFPGGSSGTWKEVDITPAVKEKLGSTLSLGIDSSGSDGLDFYSKDSSSRPRLVIKFK